jgi:hypothetical protein
MNNSHIAEDLILIKKTLMGEKEAFGQLIDKYKNFVFGDIEIKINYSYENNQSNDAVYNYSNNITSLFLVTWF